MFEAERNTSKGSHLYHHMDITELQVVSTPRTIYVISKITRAFLVVEDSYVVFGDDFRKL